MNSIKKYIAITIFILSSFSSLCQKVEITNANPKTIYFNKNSSYSTTINGENLDKIKGFRVVKKINNQVVNFSIDSSKVINNLRSIRIITDNVTPLVQDSIYFLQYLEGTIWKNSIIKLVSKDAIVQSSYIKNKMDITPANIGSVKVNMENPNLAQSFKNSHEYKNAKSFYTELMKNATSKQLRLLDYYPNKYCIQGKTIVLEGKNLDKVKKLSIDNTNLTKIKSESTYQVYQIPSLITTDSAIKNLIIEYDSIAPTKTITKSDTLQNNYKIFKNENIIANRSTWSILNIIDGPLSNDFKFLEQTKYKLLVQINNLYSVDNKINYNWTSVSPCFNGGMDLLGESIRLSLPRFRLIGTDYFVDNCPITYGGRITIELDIFSSTRSGASDPFGWFSYFKVNNVNYNYSNCTNFIGYGNKTEYVLENTNEISEFLKFHLLDNWGFHIGDPDGQISIGNDLAFKVYTGAISRDLRVLSGILCLNNGWIIEDEWEVIKQKPEGAKRNTAIDKNDGSPIYLYGLLGDKYDARKFDFSRDPILYLSEERTKSICPAVWKDYLLEDGNNKRYLSQRLRNPTYHYGPFKIHLMAGYSLTDDQSITIRLKKLKFYGPPNKTWKDAIQSYILPYTTEDAFYDGTNCW